MDEQAYSELAARARTHWFAVERREHLRAVIEGLGLPPQARVLEIGCGPGSNLAMLGSFGRVTAVEPSPVALRLLRALPEGADADVRHAPWPDDAVLAADERFELIAMFDVIEHIDNDRDALQAASAALAEGGRVVITVPAHPWMWSVHDEHLHHRRRYTRATLRAAIESSGLAVEKLGGFNTILLPAAVAARMLSRALRRSDSPGRATPHPVINAVLAAIFRSERPLVRRGGFLTGLSLLAIARRV